MDGHPSHTDAGDHLLARNRLIPMSVFPCQQCGLCCQHVQLSRETQFLDRGDGVCRHHDVTSKLCRIYQGRPDICRVDRLYEMRFAQFYDWDEYVALNLQACTDLQKLTD